MQREFIYAVFVLLTLLFLLPAESSCAVVTITFHESSVTYELASGGDCDGSSCSCCIDFCECESEESGAVATLAGPVTFFARTTVVHSAQLVIPAILPHSVFHPPIFS